MSKEAKNIMGSEFFKSLNKLEQMAKSGESVEKAQICTGPNSKKTVWTGGDTEEYGDKWDDDIQEDGTDYNMRSARKAIANKVAKGQPLTAQEYRLLKSDFDKAHDDDDDDDEDKDEKVKKGKGRKASTGKNPVEGGPVGGHPLAGAYGMARKAKDDDDNEDDDDNDKDDEKKMGKSLSAEVEANPTLQKGIEISEFLSEFAKSFGVGLEGLEARVTHQVTSNILEALGPYMETQWTQQGDFNKALAEAVANLGHGIAGALQQTAELAEMPVGPPKSQLRAFKGGVVEKSFAGSQDDEGISKSMILDHLSEMVKGGTLSPLEVIKYEGSGQINPDLYAKAVREIRSGGR